ncbi:aromatic ring-hydroxylating dioxygenase subunit alpha [Ensifer sp. ENS10]|uniref:aromatic ring-hydroxylating oxygenase subunit alpha n=1 Tax=Ensifer sp. ENS10 TaxID=2769286 RepID=UPI00177F43B4|nr:aromatic ring-hydroxylating dioxygenase subunit alpha [Ensifer sp. ENS10]MBD9508761.1 aromatic ring-hydroxylating dioxygenase subunit alpha [Ensifer sp. ENS10]
MGEFRCVDRSLLNDWHVVAERSALMSNSAFTTRLMGHDLQVTLDGRYNLRVVELDTGEEVCSDSRYGFIWACLGRPERDIIYLPETNEADRHLLSGGSIAVRVSGLRAVENFLDMGHFPFVHTGWLGDEPLPYNVTITAADEVLATDCKFLQPFASPTARAAMLVDYICKVFRPYTVALYKSNPLDPDRKDLIVLFIQPVDEENCIVYSYLCYLKQGLEAAAARSFMQLIFAHDKPILENQRPRRLPLDPRAETPIRADAVSVHYRRWLRDRSVTYGAIAYPV